MSLFPVVLGVRREVKGKPGEAFPASGLDASSPELRARVLERDGNTCQFCGFTSKKYQNLVFRNGNALDTRMENLATACIFCHQCFFLETVAGMRSGVLVWLPEMDAAALHHVCRAIYIARISQGPVADAARIALDALISRRDEARKRLGTDDPAILAGVLQDFLEDKDYAMRSRKLDGIRLLPLDRRIIRDGDMEFNQFPQILAYWRSKDGPFGGVPPAGWEQLFDQVSSLA
ncbi:MAG TPA: type IV secretion protein DotN [Rhodospirillaceae bacterium]|nr:MAG: type IV secretion protein DotN [Alphaproteobacteria bacterium GWF2_58_20]HAU29964.1 type IV secretion protein DotN [Rhodospirillaceae bacterium]